MDFRVDLNIYRGPLDLLLYLVRKHELEITAIPVSLVTEQYLEYLSLLEELDVNAVGDFLEMASTLMEIKSRMVLPAADEVDEPLDDPREELVQRLLDYKRFRDAASMLEERGRQWQRRYPRFSDDLPPRKVDPADQPIREVELWDLVSALGRMIKENRPAAANIVYDDTPVSTYMQRLHERLLKEDRVAFSELFSAGMHKSAMIGVFLAVLELVRHYNAITQQDDRHGEIWVTRGEHFPEHFDLSLADEYQGTAAEESAEATPES